MTLDASVRKVGLAGFVCTKEQSFVQNHENVLRFEGGCMLTSEPECAGVALQLLANLEQQSNSQQQRKLLFFLIQQRASAAICPTLAAKRFMERTRKRSLGSRRDRRQQREMTSGPLSINQVCEEIELEQNVEEVCKFLTHAKLIKTLQLAHFLCSHFLFPAEPQISVVKRKIK